MVGASNYVGFSGEYGPVEVLPTPTSIYGMAVREEISVDIEPGKTLIVSCQAVAETEEDGTVNVFFALNGQPRAARVPHQVADDALETAIHAERDGVIQSIVAPHGTQVDAKDPLIELA